MFPVLSFLILRAFLYFPYMFDIHKNYILLMVQDASMHCYSSFSCSSINDITTAFWKMTKEV